jgi:hypothetical protein
LKFSSESLPGPRSLFCAIKTLKNKYVNFVAFDVFCKIIPGTAGHYGALSKQIGEQKPSRKQNLQKHAKTIWGTTGHYGTFSKNTKTSKTIFEKQSKMQNVQKPPGALRGTIQKNKKKTLRKNTKNIQIHEMSEIAKTTGGTTKHYAALWDTIPKTQKTPKTSKSIKNAKIAKTTTGHYGALWGTIQKHKKTQKTPKTSKSLKKCKNCKNDRGRMGRCPKTEKKMQKTPKT